jgi:hypothetical protein
MPDVLLQNSPEHIHAVAVLDIAFNQQVTDAKNIYLRAHADAVLLEECPDWLVILNEIEGRRALALVDLRARVFF